MLLKTVVGIESDIDSGNFYHGYLVKMLSHCLKLSDQILDQGEDINFDITICKPILMFIDHSSHA